MDDKACHDPGDSPFVPNIHLTLDELTCALDLEVF